MNHYILVAIAFLFTSLPMVTATTIAQESDNDSESVDVREMPSDYYFARKLAECNERLELPSLSYWGVADIQWGMSLVQAIEVRTASGTDKKQMKISENAIRNDKSSFLGVPCQSTVYLSGNGGIVGNGFRHDFASGVENRAARLAIYRKLKNQLIERYNAPTHNIAPDEVVRGEDAYVQGLDDKYHLEWHGSETVLSLRLSDKELVVEFKPSPKSRALAHRENVAKANAFIQEQIAQRGKLKEKRDTKK